MNKNVITVKTENYKRNKINGVWIPAFARMTVLSYFVVFPLVKCPIIFAESDNTEKQALQAELVYSASSLRDPFLPLVVPEQKIVEPEKNPVLDKALVVLPPPDLSKLKAQGIIWGSKTPQAIINNKVLTVGESIEDFQITAIDKKEISLSSGGNLFTLSTSVSAPADKDSVPNNYQGGL